MPILEYRCARCEKTAEILVLAGDDVARRGVPRVRVAGPDAPPLDVRGARGSGGAPNGRGGLRRRRMRDARDVRPFGLRPRRELTA